MSNKINQHKKLSKVKEYYFDPRLISREEIECFLLNCQVGAAHPFNGNLLCRLENRIEEINLENINPKIFLDVGNRQEIESQITDALHKYHQLNFMKNYTIEFLTTGAIINIKVIPDSILSFVASVKKDEHYFDFSAYTINQNTNYRKKNGINGLVHSGDIGKLLHTIKITNNLSNGKNILFGAIGFRKRNLRYFTNQVPIFAIVDHQNELIYLVPLPLDQATLGDATFAGLVVGKYNRGYMEFKVLSRPTKLDNIDTEIFNDQVKRAVISTFVDADNMQIQQDAELIESEHKNENKDDKNDDKKDEKKDNKRDNKESINYKRQPIIQFIQDGLDEIIPVSNSDLITFSRGLNNLITPPTEKSLINLPIVFGPASGISALALGKQPIGDCIPTQDELFH